MITFYFHSSNTVFGKAIKFFSRGQYTHVSIGVNGYIYEAREGKGVIRRKADTDLKSVNYVHFFDLDEKAVEEFLKKQLGKGYDWLGVLSFVWRFIRQGRNVWYCSELALVALAKGKGVKEYNQRQSPTDFYYITKIAL